jgi:Uma2 family endonuclease
MSVVADQVGLLTLEDYLRLSPPDERSELVRGRVVRLPPRGTSHGYYCGRICSLLDEFVRSHHLGRVTVGDSGVVTRRDPDSLRGIDVAYYSYARVAEGAVPQGYWPAPELAVEVKSPSERWPEIHSKVAEYLEAGVLIVLLVDPRTQTVQVYSAEEPVRVLQKNDTLELRNVLPGFAVPLQEVFE